jgi:16S rRNA (cytosine1402-N4)-methyltransferase
MPDEAVTHLLTDPSGIYVDCTLGSGGHARHILSNLNDDATLYGLDQDDEALNSVRQHLQDHRLELIKGNFGYLSTLLPPTIHHKVSGFLFDLGVSRHQITEPERGFSFDRDGPLDMRMSNLMGIDAHHVVNKYGYEKLRDVIYHFGEERKSREIAKTIIERRPIETTGQLADIVASLVPEPHQKKSIARVFQGIRIEVNRELEMLRRGLEQAHDWLQVGGRIVAISYHSLEDRIVKRYFKSGNHEGKVEKDFFGNEMKTIQMLTKNVVRPSEEEVNQNPAARSAKLRAAEKIEPEGGESP